MSDAANKTSHSEDDATFYPSYLCTHYINVAYEVTPGRI